jgi:hypothetical protein
MPVQAVYFLHVLWSMSVQLFRTPNWDTRYIHSCLCKSNFSNSANIEGIETNFQLLLTYSTRCTEGECIVSLFSKENPKALNKVSIYTSSFNKNLHPGVPQATNNSMTFKMFLHTKLLKLAIIFVNRQQNNHVMLNGLVEISYHKTLQST